VSGLGQQGYATLPITLSAADVGAPHRRARIFLVARRVPDPHRSTLRDGSERGPGRRAGRIPDQGQPEPTYLGEPVGHAGSERPSVPGSDSPRRKEHAASARAGGRNGGVADTDSNRQQGGRQSQHGGLEGAPRAQPVGCGDDRGFCWPPGPLDGAGWDTWTGPQPAVRRGVDGFPRSVDRARLRALGNSVVPQCAEVIGHVIRELM